MFTVSYVRWFGKKVKINSKSKLPPADIQVKQHSYEYENCERSSAKTASSRSPFYSSSQSSFEIFAENDFQRYNFNAQAHVFFSSILFAVVRSASAIKQTISLTLRRPLYFLTFVC